jgi:cell division inhibitor SepF
MSRGIWHGTLVYLGLKEEPEEGYDELPERFVPEDDPHAEHAPARPTPLHEPSRASVTRSSAQPSGSSSASVTSSAAAAPANVHALHPDVHVRAVASSPVVRAAIVEIATFDDVEAVGSRYRTGQPVLFDLGAAPSPTARRVVDFVSGLTYASHGKLTKVGRRAFLLVPDGVELPADDQRRLHDLGYRLASTGSEA